MNSIRLNTALTGFVTLGVLLFLIISTSLIKISDIFEEEFREVVRLTESLQIAEALKSALLEHNREANFYLLRGKPLGGQDLTELQIQTIRYLDQSKRISRSEQKQQLIATVREKISAYFDMRERLDVLSGEPLEEYQKISTYINDALLEINKLIARNAQQATEALAKVETQNRMVDIFSILLMAFVALIGATVLLGMVSLVYRPLSDLKQDIDRYQGSGNIRAEVKGAKEIRDIALTFNIMAERLENLRNNQLRFVASVAHDLRNPLAAISGAAELALRSEETQNKDLSNLILNQIKGLERQVSDLLDASRIEAGQLQLSYTENDICALIKDTINLYRSTSKIHQFDANLQGCPIQCVCDPHRLSQVLNNLVSNAIKYSPTGGRVSISAWVEKENCHISVEDQGIGIEPENLEDIFKPFQRTETTRNTIPGIGLGLSTSKRIIQAHGGKIKVDSVPGKGATFLVFLPLVPPVKS